MMDIEDLQRVYREVFSSDEGKRVLDDLKARFGFQQTTHVPGDPYESAFFEGQRNAVLLILRMMEEKRKDLTSE
jgi:hypothetical protein|tara:strand:+ start:148 stop:369 length:222 start_codon:yes stop_codon:yes gene_type:complete